MGNLKIFIKNMHIFTLIWLYQYVHKGIAIFFLSDMYFTCIEKGWLEPGYLCTL